jgi:hypothetical protein
MKPMRLAILGLCLAFALTACSDDDTPATTTPVPDPVNALNGTGSGGAAVVVMITAYDAGGAENIDYIYDDDLSVDCDAGWMAQGSLCNLDPSSDDINQSIKMDSDSGATWENDDPAVTGVLVIDGCSDGSCTSIKFSEARIFQMFSDGELTHARLAVHAEMGDTPPAWDDAGWTVVTSAFEPVGPGATADEGVTVTAPTVIELGAQDSRYVRVEARNDKTRVETAYIELRSIKLF